MDIDVSQSVGDLKEAIQGKNKDIQCPARNLHFFLAKMTGGAWLKDDDPASQQLSGGKTHPHIQQMISEKQAIVTSTHKR